MGPVRGPKSAEIASLSQRIVRGLLRSKDPRIVALRGGYRVA